MGMPKTFLRVKLEKVDEMPVINGICALPQIIKLNRDWRLERSEKGSCHLHIGGKTHRSS